MNENLEKAIKYYTDNDLYIFPIKKGSKIPKTAHGFKDSTNDFNTAMKLFHDGDNIGLETGTRNNIYAIDFDVKKENHKPVMENGRPLKIGFINFCKEFKIKNLSDKQFNTRIVKTQSGGFHIYYKLPEGKEPIKQAIGKIPGVDLKGMGGYVVAPPSKGEFGEYEVVKDMEFKDIPEMPLNFYNFFMPEKKKEKTEIKPGNFNSDYERELTGLIGRIFESKTGIGNDLTMCISGAMATHGITEEKALEIMKNASIQNMYDKEDWKPVVSTTYQHYRNGDEIKGLPTLLEDLEKIKTHYGEFYNEIVDTLKVLFAPNKKSYTVILKKDREYGIIEDSTKDNTGSIIHTKIVEKSDQFGNVTDEERVIELLQYTGKIYVCKLEDSSTGIVMQLDAEPETIYTVDEAISHLMQHYGITPSKKQMLVLILRRFALQYGKDAVFIPPSEISLKDKKIFVNYDTSKINIKEAMQKLKDFIKTASNPEGYMATFAWSLLAPLHYWVKLYSDMTVYVPNLVLSGKTKGGKTSLGDIFILKGYDVSRENKEKFLFHLQDVTTTFTLMNSLKSTNLPAIFDEIGMQFFNMHKESIKGYGSSIRFGQRGTSSQNINKYIGMRSFMATMNEDMDLSADLALSGRLVIVQFTENNTKRMNLEEYRNFFDSLPNGFMFAIFKEIFEGMDIKKVVKKLERCTDPDKWIETGIELINIISDIYGIYFPQYNSVKSHAPTVAFEIADAMASEYNRIKDNQYHPSPWGELTTEEHGSGKDKRIFIYFTGSAYRNIIKKYGYFEHLKASEYMNNIPKEDDVRVENNGERIPMRIYGKPGQFYCVSIPDNDYGHDNRKNTENSNDDSGNDKNTPTFDMSYTTIPPWPVTNEMKQNEEKPKEREIEEAKVETAHEKIKDKPDNFFFYKSESECFFTYVDSFEFSHYTYYKFNDNEVDKTPLDWNRWVMHSIPIKENEFEKMKSYSMTSKAGAKK